MSILKNQNTNEVQQLINELEEQEEDENFVAARLSFSLPKKRRLSPVPKKSHLKPLTYISGTNIQRSSISETHVRKASISETHVRKASVSETHVRESSLPARKSSRSQIMRTSAPDAWSGSTDMVQQQLEASNVSMMEEDFLSNETEIATVTAAEKLQRKESRKDNDIRCMKALEGIQKLDQVQKSLMLLEDNYEDLLMQFIESEDDFLSRSSSIMSLRARPSCTVRFKDEFLIYFDDLPSLSNVSTSYSDDQTEKNDEEEEEIIRDHGVFLDPLTGEEQSTTESMSDISFGFDGEEGALDRGYHTDCTALSIASSITSAKMHSLDTYDLEAFVAFRQSLELSDEEEFEDNEAATQLRLITHQFIYDLINQAVETVEHADRQMKLETNLNKEKLKKHLLVMISEFIAEKYYNVELNRKIYEYHKSQKSLRSFIPRKSTEEEESKYRRSLNYYDHLLQNEIELSAQHNEVLEEATQELDNEMQISTECDNDFERLIKKTFASRRFSNIREKIVQDMAFMTKKRKFISDERIRLMLEKDTWSTLTDKWNKHDIISDNLTMSTYISKQTEVQAMEMKIEERSGELLKLRSSCNRDLQAILHTEEKIDVLNLSIARKEYILKQCMQLQYKTREDSFKHNVMRCKLQKKLRDVNYKSGILNMKSLLLDYDETQKILKDQKEKNSQLRESLDQVLEKINAS